MRAILGQRGSGNWLTHILMAVLGAMLAAGLLLAFNLDSGAVGIAAAFSVGLPTLWVTWAAYRDARRVRHTRLLDKPAR